MIIPVLIQGFGEDAYTLMLNRKKHYPFATVYDHQENVFTTKHCVSWDEWDKEYIEAIRNIYLKRIA